MSRIAVGQEAPDFALPTDRGKTFRLSEHRGNPVILVFYPQADTEGCTLENVEFTQLLPKFGAAGATVVSISPDSVAKHCAFRDKYELKLILLSDPDHLAIEAYGLWGDKKMFGVEFKGLIRTTVIVGPDGRIAGILKASRIKGHAQKVLEATQSLVKSA